VSRSGAGKGKPDRRGPRARERTGRSGRADGSGKRLVGRPRGVGEKKRKERGPRPAGLWGKEKREKREAVGRAAGEEKKKGWERREVASWAGSKGEEREREKERRKTNAFEFVIEI
jgi:hypothetical protein